jgi:hypothetical protein
MLSMSIPQQRSAQQDDAFRVFQDGERLEHEGRSVEAENVYRKALKIAPLRRRALQCRQAARRARRHGARDPAFQRISGDREDARLT